MSYLKRYSLSFIGTVCLYFLCYFVLNEWSRNYVFSFKETIIFLNPSFIYKAYYLSWNKIYLIFGLFLIFFLTFFCLFDWLIRKINKKRKEKEVLNFIDGIANEEF